MMSLTLFMLGASLHRHCRAGRRLVAAITRALLLAGKQRVYTTGRCTAPHNRQRPPSAISANVELCIMSGYGLDCLAVGEFSCGCYVCVQVRARVRA